MVFSLKVIKPFLGCLVIKSNLMEECIVYKLTGVLSKFIVEEDKSYVTIKGEVNQNIRWEQLDYNIYIKEDIRDLSDNDPTSSNDSGESGLSKEHHEVNNDSTSDNDSGDKKYIILKVDEKIAINSNLNCNNVLASAFKTGKKLCIVIDKDNDEYVIKKVEIDR